MTSFGIKTYFDLFNIVSESFLIFYTAYKVFIEAVAWNLLHLGESWRCRKGPERLLHAGKFEFQ